MKIAPNFFFEWENGEAFYPIMASNWPTPLENGTEAFYAETIPAYLDVLSRHGVNMMRHYPFAQSFYLQDWEGAPFLDNAVATYDKYFDALEQKGLKYMIATYDYSAMKAPEYASVYYAENFRGGTVSMAAPGAFFQWDEGNRNARADFRQALGQFREAGNPPWVMREGLMGWDLFSELDYIETGPPDMYYSWEGEFETAPNKFELREQMIGNWMAEMLAEMGLGEQNWLGLGRRRFHWVSTGNLRRFKQWDPDHDQPQYLDLHGVDATTNDYIDYHLYCDLAVENPTDPFTPLKFFLGIELGTTGDLASNGCTLPDVIDHYRKPDAPRRGGFFSSEIGLQWMDNDSTKCLINDCNHNYLWLGFASGSVGGPAMWVLPNPGPVQLRLGYDLSGVEFNNYNPVQNYDLNSYTEEILDSFLSLSRFTSLVRWQCVSDPNLLGPLYRPVRNDPATSVTIQDNSGDSETQWVWTAASDGTITIGWLVRNYYIHQDYHEPGIENAPPPIAPPTVTIAGLAHIPLELVWFDDHKGCIVGDRTVRSDGQFPNITAPYTETSGFGKSIAFLIQPVGFTPNVLFDPLPNEMIGQIVITPRDDAYCFHWNDEWPWVHSDVPLVFRAKTNPPIANPTRYKFLWYFEDTGAQPPQDGVDYIAHTYTTYPPYGGFRVTVDILDKYQGDMRVSGDLITVYVSRW